MFLMNFFLAAEETQPVENNNTPSTKSKFKSRVETQQKSQEVSSKENQKPMNGKLDISKFRSLVERNTLDNDRLKQKAEARKSDSNTNSRLEPEQEKKLNNNEKVDNSKHHKDADTKPDNYQHVETENGAVKRKKKKKKKSERGDCLSSTKTLQTNSDDKSDDLDSKSSLNSKLNAGNRFSRVDGPRIPKR